MKKKIIGVLVLMLFLFGCSKNKEFEAYQGKWFDVNSSTIIEFKGNKMTIDTGFGSKTYAMKTDVQYGKIYIEFKESGKCYSFSRLEVCDGFLLAFEEVLDADGHTYRFVRSENLEKEKAIQDCSEDLPKKIESNEIIHFSLYYEPKEENEFSVSSLWPVGANCSWNIDLKEDGSYWCEYTEIFDSYMGNSYQGEVSKEFVDQLALLIQENDVAQYNGYYFKNNEGHRSLSLYIDYQSEEKIVIRAQGKAADTCVFNIAALLQHLCSIVEEQ